VATNAVFRRQMPLLVFHLALIAVVILAAAGRMTYLKGQVEVSVGDEFSGELNASESGPWHVSRLAAVRFANRGFDIEYDAGVKRGRTRNFVIWVDSSGAEQQSTIGDTVPLVVQGYRFYTSFNKGFAPIFLWQPANGEAHRGTIHLPAYPLHEFRQALEWTPPGSRLVLWTQLQFDDMVLDPERASNFRTPKRHWLVVRSGESRWELRPGQRLSLPGGVLRYEGLTTWMGYNVFYDWTIPWLLAACGLAAISLALHFLLKFRGRPWDQPV
jgi:cytochrome c biogenesis protein